MTYTNNSKYTKSSSDNIEGIETLGFSDKDSKNIKNKLANLRPNVSSVKALSTSDVVMLVHYGHYMALANVLIVKDL